MAKLTFTSKFNNQRGQTLIETLVAAMVLVMGISAAVGLATYGLAATTGVTKQLIAVGLAREGIEAVKNIRDSNWLSTQISNDCYDFYTISGPNNIASCYRNWLNNLSDGTYVLSIDGSTLDSQSYWRLQSSSGKYGLDYSNSNTLSGFYTPAFAAQGSSGYSRKITLSSDNFAPFNQDLGPRLKVHVDVWWQDKRCPASDDVPASASCKVSLETYLTNWKNY